MKKFILKAMLWAAVALVVPLLGNQFVDGWNWSLGDFIFAWVFWVVMAVCIRFAITRIPNIKYRIAIGIVVFLAFATVWVMLATG